MNERDWWAKAHCLGQDPDLFTLPDIVKSKHFKILEESARTFCPGCPVEEECLRDASKQDLEVSVRGGQAPRPIKAEPKPPEYFYPGRQLLTDGVCRNGHVIKSAADLWYFKGGKKVRCLKCAQNGWRTQHHKKKLKRAMV